MSIPPVQTLPLAGPQLSEETSKSPSSLGHWDGLLGEYNYYHHYPCSEDDKSPLGYCFQGLQLTWGWELVWKEDPGWVRGSHARFRMHWGPHVAGTLASEVSLLLAGGII